MKKNISKTPELDVVVIGAGFCGSIVAIRAHELGARVRVIDSHARYPNYFRAEKLETDQFQALVDFGLIDHVEPKETPLIERVHTFTGNKLTVNAHSKHRGIHYSDTVNSLRDSLRERGLIEIRKIAEIKDRSQASEIVFECGERLSAGLTVIATGMSAGIRKPLGLATRAKENLVSTTFGFNLALNADCRLPFKAVNFRPKAVIPGLSYLSFFPVGETRRANLFTCWEPQSEQTKRFKRQPVDALAELFPDLESRIGKISLSSDVQAYTTRYYRMAAQHLHRTVLVGDAFQSVSPATGVGLSKCLVDARVLTDLLPSLLQDAHARVDLEAYYGNEKKRQTDDLALGRWRWTNELSTGNGVKIRLKKFKRHAVAMIRQVSR